MKDKKVDVETPVYGVLRAKKKTAEKIGRIMPEPEIKRTVLPKEVAALDIENLVDIPEDLLKKVIKRTKQATSAIKDSILLHDIPVVLSHDNATSYAEVALRDGLGIDIEIDDDVLQAVDQLNRLSLLYQYVRMIKLPKKVRQLYIEKLAELMAQESLDNMKKASASRKYSQKLRELTGVVRSRADDKKEFNVEEFVSPKEEGKKNRSTRSGVYRSRKKE